MRVADTGRHVGAATALLLVSMAIIGVNPLRQTLAPVDLLVSSPGFLSAGVRETVVNQERSDVLDFVLPNWRFFRRELRAGRLPLWNPLNQLGSPGIQQPTFEGISVPFLVFATVPDESMGYTLAIASNFLLAASGCYLLLFFMFGSRSAALFGALAFAFSGFNVGWAHWPHLTTSAWIPWVLAAEVRYWQTARVRWLVLFAVSVALLALGGFPFVAVVGAVAALILAVCLVAADWYQGRQARAIGGTLLGLTVGGLAGVALAAPALASMVQFVQSNDLSYRTAGTILRPADLLHLFGRDWNQAITIERTFYCGILAAVFAVGGAVRALFRRDRYALFGVALAAFVLATAYGLAPRALVTLIPSFGFNPWHRAGVLTGLAFAVLAASFLRWIVSSASTPRRRVAATVFVGLVICLQAVDLSRQFARYNAKPSRDAYFPHTPALDYVAAHIEPFQSVLADSGFLVSGTVSAYGLPELFAHGFRTPGQRALMTRIVSEPFTTPTASLFECGRVDFPGRAAVLAATRYFLVSAGDCLERLAATTGNGERLSPPLDAGPLSGTVIVPRAISPELAAVELATAGGAPFASDVRFELFLGEARVAASVVPGRSVQNTGATRFPLALSAPLAPGTYRYVITVLQPGGGRLSARTFASGGPYSIGGTETPGTPRVQFLRSKSPDGLVLHQPGQNVIVAENPAVSGGAYFVRSLDPDAAVDFSRVHVNAHRPSDFQLRYEGTAPGFVVVPMRTSGDWVATVNGTPAAIAAFHNVFTAVAVDGPADIHLRFATGALAASAVAGWAAAVLLLVGAALTSRRLRTSAAGRA